MRKLCGLLKVTYRSWSAHHASQVAGSLAYFALFSVAPLALIATAIAGSVYGRDAATGEVARQIGKTFSPQVAAAVQQLVLGLSERKTLAAAYGLGSVTLLLGAAELFGQLKAALDTIWGVERKATSRVWPIVKEYLLSVALVMFAGLLLLASLVYSALLHAFSARFHASIPADTLRAHLVDGLASFCLFTLIFAVLFRVLPDVRIAWRPIWLGSALTSALFVLGKALIALYLGRSGAVSAYGAAGSFILLLLWVYYSAQIFLFGAEFTRAYATAHGERVDVVHGAMRA